MVDETGMAVFDLRRRPIEDRKAALERLIRRKLPQGTDWLNTFEIDHGALVFEEACALGCEGA